MCAQEKSPVFLSSSREKKNSSDKFTTTTTTTTTAIEDVPVGENMFVHILGRALR
jgi:hypothetical protein